MSLRGPAVLFCPADRPDRVHKAAAAADSVVVDLEDAIAADRKSLARNALRDLLDRLDPARTAVRVNGIRTPWHAADLDALADHPHVPVMLPMVTTAAEVESLSPRPVIALCETATGILAAPEIARARNCRGLMWGSEDLVADLHGRPGRTAEGRLRPVLEQAQGLVLLAARAAGRFAVDAVFVDIADTGTLRADARDAVAAGFDAKACIHPNQVTPIRDAFRPTEREMAWAREVLAAAATETGAFRLHGQMIDAPVLTHAESIINATQFNKKKAI